MLCFSQMIGMLPRHKPSHPSPKPLVSCLTSHNLFFMTIRNDSAKMFYREIKIKKSDSFDFLIPFFPPQLFFDIKMCHNLCFKCRLFLTLGKQG